MDEPEGPSKQSSFIVKVLKELGLITVYNSPRDTKLLFAARFVRLFAYGASTLILVSYLAELGVSDTRIGLFMTLTLIGDVVISFILTIITDAIGRRKMLALGALLMTGSGTMFGLLDNYYLLLLAAIVGIISPAGNEIGPFRAIEESTLAHLNPKEGRTDVFAWYTMIGNAGAATGLVACGWLVELLTYKAHWHKLDAYRMVFLCYGAFGIIKFGLALCLSSRCEAESANRVIPSGAFSEGERAPLLAENSASPSTEDDPPRGLLPHISKESRGIFIRLALLFALDSFASGLAPLPWIISYFKRRFDLSDAWLGSFFSLTANIAAASMIVAASLARRIGNIRTMVFTHLPSAVALALLGMPNSQWTSMQLLLFRACTQSMDSAPRQAFVAAVVLPGERTAVMGSINVIKTAAQSLGPIITGALFERYLYMVVFMLAGGLKIVYDLALLAVFVNHKMREDRDVRDADASGGVDGEGDVDVARSSGPAGQERTA